MQVQSIDNNLTFGNTRGGIKYLKIIKEGNNIRFINSAKEASDVSVFVAGGAEIDRLVRKANIKALNKYKEPPSETNKKKSPFLKLIYKLFRL